MGNINEWANLEVGEHRLPSTRDILAVLTSRTTAGLVDFKCTTRFCKGWNCRFASAVNGPDTMHIENCVSPVSDLMSVIGGGSRGGS